MTAPAPAEAVFNLSNAVAAVAITPRPLPVSIALSELTASSSPRIGLASFFKAGPSHWASREAIFSS